MYSRSYGGNGGWPGSSDRRDDAYSQQSQSSGYQGSWGKPASFQVSDYGHGRKVSDYGHGRKVSDYGHGQVNQKTFKNNDQYAQQGAYGGAVSAYGNKVGSGTYSSLPGNMSSMPGNMQPMTGNRSSMTGNMSSMIGNMPSMPGNLSMAGNMPGNMSSMTGNMQPMTGNRSSLTGNMSSMTGNMSSMTGNMSSMTGNMSSMTGNMPSMTGNMSSMTGSMSSMTGNMPSMAGNMSSLMGNMPSMTGNMRSMPGDMSSMSGNMPSMTGNIRSMTGNMPSMSGNMSSMSGGFGNASSKQDMSSLMRDALARCDALQGRSSGFNRNPQQDPESKESKFMTELKIRMAAEVSQNQDGGVDVDKIVKVMNIVDKLKADYDLDQIGGNQSGDLNLGNFLTTPPVGSFPTGAPQGRGMHQGHFGGDPGDTWPMDTGMARTNMSVMSRFGGGGMPPNVNRQNMGMSRPVPLMSRHNRPDLSLSSQRYGNQPSRDSSGHSRSRNGNDDGRFKFMASPGRQRHGSYGSSRDSGDRGHNSGGRGNMGYHGPQGKLSKREEQIKKLTFMKNYVRQTKPNLPEFNRLQSAMSKCNNFHNVSLKFNTTQRTYLNQNNLEMISFGVSLDDIFLEKGEGRVLKKVRKEVYDKVFTMLTTWKPEAILKHQATKNQRSVPASATKATTSVIKKKQQQAQKPPVETRPDSDFPNLKKLNDAVQTAKANHREGRHCEVVDNALRADSSIEYEYEEREKKQATGLPWFIGTLKLDGVVIGAGSAANSTKAKSNAYSKAFNVLSKKFQSVKNGMVFNEENYLVGYEVLPSLNNFHRPNKATESNLAKMMKKVADIPQDGSIEDGIDAAAKSSGVVLMRVIKFKKAVNHCEIYLDNIFLTVGMGKTKLEARKAAYAEAQTILTSSTADIIFNEFTRISTADSLQVREVFEFGIEEKVKTTLLNQTVVKGKWGWLEFQTTTDYFDLVVMENESMIKNRIHNAIGILQQTAYLNCMRLEGKLTESSSESVFRCDIFIQGERIFHSFAGTKDEAIKRTAAKALYSLYHKCPTIRVGVSVKRKVVTRDSLLEEAEEVMPDLDAKVMEIFTEQIESDELINYKNAPIDQKSEDASTEQKSEDASTEQKSVDTSTEQKSKDASTEQKSEEMEESVNPEAVEESKEEEASETKMDTSEASVQAVDEPEGTKNLIHKLLVKKLIDFKATESIEEVLFTDFRMYHMKIVSMTCRHLQLRFVRKTRNDFIISQKLLPKRLHEILLENGGKLGRYSIVPMTNLPKIKDVPDSTKPLVVKDRQSPGEQGQTSPNDRKRKLSGSFSGPPTQGQLAGKKRKKNYYRRKQFRQNFTSKR